MEARSLDEVEHDRKRKRLTNACTRCRQRKVRCDTRQPSCTDCLKAGTACDTFDPRRPDRPVQRREAQGVNQQSPVYSPRRTASSSSFSAPNGGGTPATAENGRIHSNGANVISRADRKGSGTFRDTGSAGAARRTAELDHMSPAGILPAMPRFVTGSSLLLLSQWLDLAFARLGSSQRFSQQYRLASSQPWSEAFTTSQSPMDTILSAQPGVDYGRLMLAVGPVIPILAATREQQVPARSRTARLLDVLRAAATAPGDARRDFSTARALDASLAYLGDIVIEASLDSVEVLVLMALTLRFSGFIELAWQAITMSATIAQSRGLHRRPNNTGVSIHRDGEAERSVRLFWSLYILMMTLSNELERAPVIREEDCNVEYPTSQHPNGQITEAAIQLAKIQCQLSERLLKSRVHEENSSIDLGAVVIEKMRTVGELDDLLTSWAQHLPAQIRPSEYLYCDAETLPAVAFMAIQYYQSLFLLHRHALILNMKNVQSEVAMHFSSQTYRHRLRNGHLICCDATRHIVSILGHIRDTAAHSVLDSNHAPLLASYGLGIHLVRHPAAGAARSDVELQASAIAIFKEHSRRKLLHGFHESEEDTMTIRLLEKLHELVRGCMVSNNKSAAHARLPNPKPSGAPAMHERPVPASPYYTTPSSVQQRQDVTTPSSTESDRNGHSERASMPLDATGSTGHTLPATWPPSLDLNFDWFAMEPGIGDLDWDALAAAFDLPDI